MVKEVESKVSCNFVVVVVVVVGGGVGVVNSFLLSSRFVVYFIQRGQSAESWWNTKLMFFFCLFVFRCPIRCTKSTKGIKYEFIHSFKKHIWLYYQTGFGKDLNFNMEKGSQSLCAVWRQTQSVSQMTAAALPAVWCPSTRSRVSLCQENVF